MTNRAVKVNAGLWLNVPERAVAWGRQGSIWGWRVFKMSSMDRRFR